MIKRLNDRMAIHLKNLGYDFSTTEYTLPTDLEELLESPIVEHNGCFLLSACCDSAPAGMNDFDKTLYEDFENHFHPDGYMETETRTDLDNLKYGLESAKRLAIRLRELRPTQFRILLSYSEAEHDGDEVAVISSSTVRFHTLRKGAEGFRDDLNSYQLDAVLEMET